MRISFVDKSKIMEFHSGYFYWKNKESFKKGSR